MQASDKPNNYRPDVDGLRAIAVCSVFVFHLLPGRFPGGGIGVDVFFVISGFLIGGILLREYERGQLSLIDFYSRRLRRIMPAFLAVMALTTACSIYLLFPSDLVSYSRSAIFAILSVSNIYLATNVDYFDQESSTYPLLHTWSLGVEEQFYLAAPIILTLNLLYFTRRNTAILLGVLIASFYCSVYLVESDRASAFYYPQSRAWEFLAGVLINKIPAKLFRSKLFCECVAWICMVGLGASLWLIDPSNGFPGYQAIAPIMCAAGLIATGSHTLTSIGAALSAPPVRFIGLISYSLYLWHWPVIVMIREYLGVANSSRAVIPLSISITFALSILSWRYIEQPFRFSMPSRLALLVIGTTSAVLIGTMLFIAGTGGLPARFPASATAALVNTGAYDENGAACLYRGIKRDPKINEALCLDTDHQSSILLLGDSHAAMFRSAIQSLSNRHVVQLTAAACDIPKLATDTVDIDCIQYLKRAMDVRINWDRIDTVVLSARWSGNELGEVHRLISMLGKRAKVIVVGPTPEFEERVPKLWARSILANNPRLITKMLRPDLKIHDRELAEAAARSGAQYISPLNLVCPSDCEITLGGIPFFIDRDHVSIAGARHILERAQVRF